MFRLIFLFTAMTATSCRDHEQSARATGESARASAQSTCASIPPSDEERGSCVRRACDPACAGWSATPAFHKTCLHACTADAECGTDADCASTLLCVAIAPRVRRCRPRPTSHTSPYDPGSAASATP